MLKTRIWEIRTQRKITLVKLSKLSGISKTVINNIENGKVSPRLSQIEKLIKALNVDIRNFFVYDNKEISAYAEIDRKGILNTSNKLYNADTERVDGMNINDNLRAIINDIVKKVDKRYLPIIYQFVKQFDKKD